MKKYIALILTTVLVLSLLAGCVTEFTTTLNTSTEPYIQYPSSSSPQTTTPPNTIPPSQLSVSDELFFLGSDPFRDGGGGPLDGNWIVYCYRDTENLIIIFYVLGARYVLGNGILPEGFMEYATDEEWSAVRSAGSRIHHQNSGYLWGVLIGMSENIQVPDLYRAVHFFDITYEELVAANLGDQYRPELLRAMFYPREEMLAVTLEPNGAIFNGVVHNIWTLNYVFENDVDAFVEICLYELIDFQVRLEDMNIFTGFNEDMVEFANANNVRRR